MIGVVKDGAWKVGQYGQWDGYPEGQGSTILDFFAQRGVDALRSRIDQVRWITDSEIDDVNTELRANNKDVVELYPELSRDTGADILKMIANMADGQELRLHDQHGFAGDGLFCEWAYVIDLDTDSLEVYKGFNQDPDADFGRFANDPSLEKPDSKIASEYTPVVLVATYELAELPSIEQLVADVSSDEEDEEAA